MVDTSQFMIDKRLLLYKQYCNSTIITDLQQESEDWIVSSKRSIASRQTRTRISMSTTQEPTIPSPKPTGNEDDATATATCFCGAVQLAFVGLMPGVDRLFVN